MRPVHIAPDDGPFAVALDEALNTLAEYRIITHPCHHCGCPIRYPLVVGAHDRAAFLAVMEGASAAMMRLGITGNLIAEMRAQTAILNAQRSTDT